MCGTPNRGALDSAALLLEVADSPRLTAWYPMIDGHAPTRVPDDASAGNKYWG